MKRPFFLNALLGLADGGQLNRGIGDLVDPVDKDDTGGAGGVRVFQHRGGTPPVNRLKLLSCFVESPDVGVSIGVDWDPTESHIERHAVNEVVKAGRRDQRSGDGPAPVSKLLADVGKAE